MTTERTAGDLWELMASRAELEIAFRQTIAARDAALARVAELTAELATIRAARPATRVWRVRADGVGVIDEDGQHVASCGNEAEAARIVTGMVELKNDRDDLLAQVSRHIANDERGRISARADSDALAWAAARVIELEAANADLETQASRRILRLQADAVHLRAELAEARAPRHVTDAGARIRSDIRESIDVLYGEIGGQGDTAAEAEDTYRAIARDMATVLDWLAPPPTPGGTRD